jgi:hypothetical protein
MVMTLGKEYYDVMDELCVRVKDNMDKDFRQQSVEGCRQAAESGQPVYQRYPVIPGYPYQLSAFSR